MLVNEVMFSVLSIMGVQESSGVDYNINGDIYGSYYDIESGKSEYRFGNSSEISLNRVSKGESKFFHEMKLAFGPVENSDGENQDIILKDFNWSFSTDYGKISLGRKINNNLKLMQGLMPENDDHYYSNTIFSERFGENYNNQLVYSNYIRSVGFSVGAVEDQGEFINLATDIDDFSFGYSYWRNDWVSQLSSISKEFGGTVVSGSYFSKDGFSDLYGLSAYHSFDNYYVGGGVFADSTTVESVVLNSYYYVNSSLSLYGGVNFNNSGSDMLSLGVNFKF